MTAGAAARRTQLAGDQAVERPVARRPERRRARVQVARGGDDRADLRVVTRSRGGAALAEVARMPSPRQYRRMGGAPSTSRPLRICSRKWLIPACAAAGACDLGRQADGHRFPAAVHGHRGGSGWRLGPDGADHRGGWWRTRAPARQGFRGAPGRADVRASAAPASPAAAVGPLLGVARAAPRSSARSCRHPGSRSQGRDRPDLRLAGCAQVRRRASARRGLRGPVGPEERMDDMPIEAGWIRVRWDVNRGSGRSPRRSPGAASGC